jgi:hypothetical protein
MMARIDDREAIDKVFAPVNAETVEPKASKAQRCLRRLIVGYSTNRVFNHDLKSAMPAARPR